MSSDILVRLFSLIEERRQDLPSDSYTTRLFRQGTDHIRQKVGEEAVEVVLARQQEDMVNETADLLYHLLVLLCAMEIPLSALFEELDQRFNR